MIDEISDTRLQSLLKKKIAQRPDDIKLLKSIYYCGSKVAHALGAEPGVFVLANDKTAKFFGQTSCKNAWACPVCSARQMAQYATEIATAIDALAKPKYNQTAFMLTLTIPHTRGMTCYESTEIIYNAWKKFIVRGNHNLKIQWKARDTFATFCEETGCKHRVRVAEYTWGEHGWHPHFHCLFWVDNDKFHLVKGWQEEFQQRWLTLVKRETLRMWNKLFPDKKDDNKTRLRIMYERLNEESKAAYISVDKKGEVIKQKSSNYICGWAADREVTGNVRNKATKEGHYTPHQILELAQSATTTEEREKWLNIYMEYARATRQEKHRRINFSARSGIKQIIEEYMKTSDYEKTLKKNITARNENVGLWRVVYWFSEEQWSYISTLDAQGATIKFQILSNAARANARSAIDKILESYDIKRTDRKHHLERHVEDLFNAA